jgi:hypothetical protein
MKPNRTVDAKLTLRARVTGRVREKSRPKSGPNQLLPELHTLLILREKSSAKIWAAFAIFKKLPKVNTRPLGENSPNLVTLLRLSPCMYTTEKIALSFCVSREKCHWQGDQIGLIFAHWVVVYVLCVV